MWQFAQEVRLSWLSMSDLQDRGKIASWLWSVFTFMIGSVSKPIGKDSATWTKLSMVTLGYLVWSTSRTCICMKLSQEPHSEWQQANPVGEAERAMLGPLLRRGVEAECEGCEGSKPNAWSIFVDRAPSLSLKDAFTYKGICLATMFFEAIPPPQSPP